MPRNNRLEEKFDHHDDHLKAKDYDTFFGSLDSSSTRDGTQPYWGNGNTVENYQVFVNHDADVELGLKLHYRQGPDILPQTDGTYEAPAGLQPGTTNRAAWNFDFSVNTGVEDGTSTLSDFNFRIVIESGDGERAVFNLTDLGPGNTPWLLSDGTPVGFADEDGSDAQISQNSVNFGFAFMQALFGADFNDAGEHYDIALQAFDGFRLIGVVNASVDIV